MTATKQAMFWHEFCDSLDSQLIKHGIPSREEIAPRHGTMYLRTAGRMVDDRSENAVGQRRRSQNIDGVQTAHHIFY